MASPRRIRVAFCITELDWGGAERCCADVAMGLDRERFETSVYSLAPRPADERRSLAPRLEAAGVPVHFLNLRGAAGAPLALARLTRALRRERPDILQTFLYHANMLGRFAALLAATPCVVSGIRVAERRGKARLIADRWTASLVDRHVCVSEDVARFSHEVGGLPRDRLVVIGNGVDAQLLTSAGRIDISSFGLDPSAPVVLYVGRLDEQKGLAPFLREWTRRRGQLPRHSLLLVGDGPERATLEAIVKAGGADDVVRFAGWRDDVPRILNAAHILVLPSKWEGMPNVVLEAMAVGLPVVTYDVEGVKQALGGDAHEQIAPQGDAGALFARLEALLSNAELRRTIGERNSARVGDHFTKQAMVDAYAQLYESLYDRSRRAAQK